MKMKLGFIGLGTMGLSMVKALTAKGYDVTVTNRSKEVKVIAEEIGARWAESPKEVSKVSDIVMLAVADEVAIKSVTEGENGLFSEFRPNQVLVSFCTVSTEMAKKLARETEAVGGKFLDVGMLGNWKHAEEGNLRLYVGGSEETLTFCRPVFGSLAKEISYVGGYGKGVAVKIALNLLMGIEMQALAEAVAYGVKAGIDREFLLDAIGKSGYSSPVMTFKCKRMAAQRYNLPDFRLFLMQKDMKLVLDECRELNVLAPATSVTYDILTAGVNKGMSDMDCAAVADVMEGLSSVTKNSREDH